MPEITTTDAADDQTRMPSWLSYGMVVLVVLVYFCGLNVPFMGPDEPRYAQVAREMWQAGDWLTPTLGGHPWFEKPPLLYWMEIASYAIFGVSEFAARLGPTLCGPGTVIAFWLFARTGHQKKSGADSLAVMTASTLGIIVFSHAASFDIVLTFCLTVSMLGLLAYERSGENVGGANVKPLVLFYAFAGVAVLAKGLVGLIFPFAIAAFYFVLSRRLPNRRLCKSLLWGLPLALLIAAPWHVAMYIRHGNEFVDIYFIEHHFERFTTDRYLHPQPFYFYWWVLPLIALPWVIFAIAAIWQAVQKRAWSRPILFAVSWFIVPLAFFSLSESKLPGYIMPAVPPLLILAYDWLRESPKRGRLIPSVSAASLLVALTTIVLYLPAYAERDSVKGLLEAADGQGHADDRVLTLHMISHSAEFYAAGRLLRDADGRQVKLEGAQLVLDEINNGDGRLVLVLVPVEHVSQLTEYSEVKAEVLKDNGHITIVAVSPNL